MPGHSTSLTLTAALLALFAGAWLAAALWATLRARAAAAAADEVVADNARLAALLEAAPAMLLVIAPDGSMHGAGRIAAALGLDVLPARWMGLFGKGAPFSAEDAAALGRLIADAASGGQFSVILRPTGSARIFRVDGGPAPAAVRAVGYSGFDATDWEAAAAAGRLERRSAALGR